MFFVTAAISANLLGFAFSLPIAAFLLILILHKIAEPLYTA